MQRTLTVQQCYN